MTLDRHQGRPDRTFLHRRAEKTHSGVRHSHCYSVFGTNAHRCIYHTWTLELDGCRRIDRSLTVYCTLMVGDVDGKSAWPVSWSLESRSQIRFDMIGKCETHDRRFPLCLRLRFHWNFLSIPSKSHSVPSLRSSQASEWPGPPHPIDSESDNNKFASVHQFFYLNTKHI